MARTKHNLAIRETHNLEDLALKCLEIVPAKVMASDVGVVVRCIHSWRETRHVPKARVISILTAARPKLSEMERLERAIEWELRLVYGNERGGI